MLPQETGYSAGFKLILKALSHFETLVIRGMPDSLISRAFSLFGEGSTRENRLIRSGEHIQEPPGDHGRRPSGTRSFHPTAVFSHRPSCRARLGRIEF